MREGAAAPPISSRCSVNDRGRPAWAQSTSAALARCLGIAAAACALAAAPAAAYVLQQSTAAAVTVKLSSHPPAAARSTTAKFGWKTTGTPTAVACRLDSGAYKSVRAVALLHQAETGHAHLHRAGDQGRHPQDGRLQVAGRHRRPDRSDRHRRRLRMDGGRRHPRRRRVDRHGRKRGRLLPASQLGQRRRLLDDRGRRHDRQGHRQRHHLGAVPGAGQGRERLGVGARHRPARPPRRRSTPSRRRCRCSRAAARPGRTWPR